MGLDQIEVRGARENNLRDVSVDIPKRAITVFTGVSGSGKSSLVFGTIAAESQRLINETYTAFIQSFMPNVGRPDVDTLRNLSAAILVDQERMGANSRSTVGTATDAYSMLRLVYSRLGEPHVGHSSMFSFNDPQGMCPGCEGMGRVSTVDVDAMVDRSAVARRGRDHAAQLRRRLVGLADVRRVGLLRPREEAGRLLARPSGSGSCTAPRPRSRSAG